MLLIELLSPLRMLSKSIVPVEANDRSTTRNTNIIKEIRSMNACCLLSLGKILIAISCL